LEKEKSKLEYFKTKKEEKFKKKREKNDRKQKIFEKVVQEQKRNQKKTRFCKN